MLQTKHVDIIPPLLKTCMLQTKHTCQHETKGESVVYRYSFSNPRTQVHCQQRLPACSLTHRYQFYSAVGTLTVVFLGESPQHLHTLVRVAPPHIPHMQSIQRATLAVPLTPLRLGGRILSANPVQALRAYAWIHRASKQCIRS